MRTHVMVADAFQASDGMAIANSCTEPTLNVIDACGKCSQPSAHPLACQRVLVLPVLHRSPVGIEHLTQLR
jgi:hypothetical protein